MTKRDYYQVLGVARDATDSQIKSAYRKLARQFHPDVNKAADAAEKFKEASEAYEVLADGEKRKLYDQFGHAGLEGGFGGRGRPGGFNVQDIFSGFGGGGAMNMSLDDLLAMLGGGRAARKSRRRRQPARGADLEYPITLDLLQAAQGVTTTVRVRREDGPKAGQSETLEVKIPPGVRQGQKIRLRGKGQYAAAGSGDLFIVVHVSPHPYFRCDGANILIDVPVSVAEASLGAKVDVPTIDGMTSVTIPPGTSSHQKLRLKGKGLPDGNARGDQLAVVKIVTPRPLSEAGRELMEQFAAAQPHNPRENAPWTS